MRARGKILAAGLALVLLAAGGAAVAEPETPAAVPAPTRTPLGEAHVGGDRPSLTPQGDRTSILPPPRAAAPTPMPHRLPPQVNFSRRPSGQDFDRTYPPAALRSGLSGTGVIRCRIGGDGTLQDCSVVSETPAGSGFGRAALALSRSIRVDMSGSPSPAGVMLTVPVTYHASPPRLMPRPPTIIDSPVVARPTAPQPPSDIDLLASESSDGPMRFHWLQTPEQKDFLATYPKAALDRETQGEATVDCRIGAAGGMEDCKVVSEYPAGAGFGAAAIRLVAASLKARPDARGQRVTLPVTYRPPSFSQGYATSSEPYGTPLDVRTVNPPPPPKPLSPAWKRGFALWGAGLGGVGLAMLAWMMALGVLALRLRRRDREGALAG